MGTRAATAVATTARVAPREAAANGTTVMALGRVVVTIVEAVTVAAAKVAAQQAVTVREVAGMAAGEMEVGPTEVAVGGSGEDGGGEGGGGDDGGGKERQGLAVRRLYRRLAPQITETPIYMHCTNSTDQGLKLW